jgi:hypothetical protein
LNTDQLEEYCKKEEYMTCTVAIATGLTSFRGNLLGWAQDTAHEWETLRITLVIPKKGNRYFKHCGPVPDEHFPILNEKGISIAGFHRSGMESLPYPGRPKYITEDELMRTSNSAREYLNTLSENMTKYGTLGFRGNNAIGRMIVDTKEGYLFEGANLIYGDPANYAIHGPMTDQVFACGNFFINSKLKVKAEAGIGVGYNRAKRAWELLIDRQYDCCNMEVPPRKEVENMPYLGAGITLPYFMSIFRDHGNLSPEEARMSNYVPEERGQKAVCCHGINVYTKCATICNVVEERTDLFSCLWTTFGQPCMSPFLPIYIGVNALPEDITKVSNPVARIFEDLRLTMEFHQDYAEKLKNFWTVFEIHTIEESYKVEKAATIFAEQGDIAEARSALTEFVHKKWEEATSLGKQWINILKDLPLSS